MTEHSSPPTSVGHRTFTEYRDSVLAHGLPSLDAREIPRGARTYQGTRAGVIGRTIAALIDVAAVGAVVIGIRLLLVLWFVVQPGPTEAMIPSRNAFIGFGAVLLWATWAFCWARGTRTLGGYVLGLRVVGRSGGRLGVWSAMLRSALCLVFPVGLFWAAFSRANRSVQDVLMRTSVTIDWRMAQPMLLRAAPGQTPTVEPR